LKDGLESYHEMVNIMRFEGADGKIVETDRENAKIASEHFAKVLN